MIRRHPTKTLIVVLMLLAAALGLAYVGRSGVPVPATKEPAPGDSLVVVGLGGVSWDDVSAKDTPVLWGLLRDGAAASVSVKTLHLTTCPTDGWATISSAEAAGPEASTDRPECTDQPKIVGDATHGYTVEGFDALAEASRNAAFKARLGLLGDSFAADKTCLQAIGPGAGLAAATSDGKVARYSPFQATTLVSDLAQCPVSIVDVGAILETDPDPAKQVERINSLERRIEQVMDAMPNGADLVVVGLSDRDREERLRVLTATGPHYAPGILASGSTRTVGIAQLSDVTATILQRGGVVPAIPIGGRALSVVPSENNSEATAASKLTVLTDVDTKADAMHRVVAPFLGIWIAGTALVMFVLWVMWRRARPWNTRLTRQRVLRLVRLTGILSAGMPAATFLANLVPWWRWSTSTWTLTGLLLVLVLAISGLLAAVSLNGPWSSSALGPLAAMSAITASVIGIDLLTGSHLQISSIFGLQPLVGGRFYGMGNVAFALYGAAVLLLCASMAHALKRRNAPRLAVLAVVIIGGVALAVDVLPAWGADFGGPIALVPALGFLLLSVMGVRVTVRNLTVVVLAAGLVVGLVCYLDWRRPPQLRSHPGQFLQSVIDGGAWDIIARKFAANVDLATHLPILLGAVTVLLALATWIVIRPGVLGTDPFRRLVEEAPLLRSGLISILAMCLIGFLTNDSGAAIPPVAALFTVPLVTSAVTHFMTIERRNQPVRRRRDRHHL
ncbi:hypothetical protein N865_04980 [Intrasporangium oryzae NRRL B-24470]|uniref:Uncharacterized protein n=1 Tax=Intrasporangium oryzae NRRL B-24470 TaxID=1386089 RepID=W9GCA5_9MICO|nr:hypothetical protein [Intrasporangium oryzae]EWT02448.1 hypothetical protein N865_04980 [Intrasporangium oryzae NRRL B-24470]